MRAVIIGVVSNRPMADAFILRHQITHLDEVSTIGGSFFNAIILDICGVIEKMRLNVERWRYG
jgi:hypothetical protein